jgi:hypothetical protein
MVGRGPVISTIRAPHASETGSDVIDVYLVLRYRRLLRTALRRRRRASPLWIRPV